MATATDTLATFIGLNRSWLSSMAVEESARTGYTHKVTVSAKDIAARASANSIDGSSDELSIAVMALAANEDSDSAVTDSALIVTKAFTSATANTVVCDVGDAAGGAQLLAAVTLITTGTGAERGHASYATLPEDENPLLDVNGGTQGTAAGTIYMNFLTSAAGGLDDLTDGEVTLLLKVRESSVIA